MFEEFSQWLEQEQAQLATSNWLFDVFVVLGITLLAFIVWRVLAARLSRLTQKTTTVWDDAIWYSLWKPINWLIAVVGLSLVAVAFANALDSDLKPVIPVVRQVLIVFLLAWVGMRFVRRAERQLIAVGKDQTTVHAVAKLCRAAVIILLMLAVFQTLGFSISGVLAFGGMGGLVVGMAAKDLLANFFGALIVYFDKPFKVGDWIRSPDRSIEGTVENIGWRVTKIRTFDKRPLYVPNAIFSSIAVENPSRMSHRRIKETIGIRYDDAPKMTKVVAEVELMLRHHPEIDTSQTLMVNFNSFNASSLDFFIYTFTKTTDWVKYHQVKQDVLNKVVEIVVANDAEFAFPTRTLHLASQVGSDVS
ncbi:mechanosensitive ion channel family protein [Agarivorans sp. MS3-6]|uniref:mechanosensitive ion channel family protein n=1 Tax=Agarivorans sp. TSD2052 TaxID=2937286 RepID=UPI00200FF3A1|nr:mechanosensitive ion channel family protein [Agarivorans sp. TSD2052]UPW18231.1 mechanosensitive ion channel family protein [Agarivorans sp. TSD2052]